MKTDKKPQKKINESFGRMNPEEVVRKVMGQEKAYRRAKAENPGLFSGME